MAATSKSTTSQYNMYFERWITFASCKNLSVWAPCIQDVILFLTSMFESGLSYSSINSAKSALSSMLGKCEDCCIGQHPLIIKFMKGVSKLRPPSARYEVTWDANKVLLLFKNWGTDSDLSLHFLSLKLLGLLALITAQRVQTLAAIQITDIVWEEPVQVVVRANLKCSSLRKPNVVLVLPSYAEDKTLCVVASLKAYLARTRLIRGDEQQLLISYQRPHKRVTSQSISRWLTQVLEMAGIDTKVYHGHSFRHASSSKAVRSGLSIDTILQRVGWSPQSRTFARFYNKPLDKRVDFCLSVLSGNDTS